MTHRNVTRRSFGRTAAAGRDTAAGGRCGGVTSSPAQGNRHTGTPAPATSDVDGDDGGRRSITSAVFGAAGELSALIRQSVGLSFCPFRYILGHKEIAHGDAPIEVAEVGGAGELGQFVVLDRFFPVMIRLSLRPAQWVPHNPLPKRILVRIPSTDSGGPVS